jgi:Putative peptidoglycan binding domain
MAPWYTVQQGEDGLSIALKHGFRDWQVVCNRPENADFKQQRPDPNLLFPGDRLFVPSKELRQESCQTAKKHTFIVPTPTALMRIVLEDDEGEPYAGKTYALHVGTTTYKGTTDEDGLIEHTVPLDAKEGELTVWLDQGPSGESYTWTLKIRHLDPVEETSGVQARLNNLGFDCGPVNNVFNDQTRLALKTFQAQLGLRTTGEIDEATRQKLREMHDVLT